jgi:hypothetical protein
MNTAERQIEAEYQNSPRKDGYYWVLTIDGWMPAGWERNSWWVLGEDVCCHDDEFLEIGPRLEPPK